MSDTANLSTIRPWSDEDTKVLTDMASTHTAAQIAKALGRTRNTVIGQASRREIPLTAFKGGNVRRSDAKPEFWNPERIAELHKMSNTHTAKEIAKRFGVSVATVHSKASRENLSLAVIRISTRVDEPKPRPLFEAASPVPSAAWQPIYGAPTIPLHETTEHTCKWPIGEAPFQFCGLRTADKKPYCEHHAGRAYRPAPPIKINGKRK